MRLRLLVETEICDEVRKSQGADSTREEQIRSAFLRGMMLGAKLQTAVAGPENEEEGWCAIRGL